MSHRLLLADDSITIQKVVELVLTEEDFEIQSVGNGDDALNLIKTFIPDIILADIEMPKMNGYQLCEKIKKDPATAGIPVILLAGAFEQFDEDLAKQVGADDSVVKPFESQELISKINSVLTLASAGSVGEFAAEGIEAEPLEMAEAPEAVVEAEAVEIGGLDEDLWAMEEFPEEPAEVIAEPEAEAVTAGTEEIVEMAVEAEAEEELVVEAEREPVVEPAERPEEPRGRETFVPSAEAMPSKEEFLKVFEKTVDERVNSLLSTIDIRESLISSLQPMMKETIEKVLWDVAPELAEKTLKEILKGSLASLTTEVEKVIWETVPDLASSMISKEIERIKSEF